MHRNATPFKFFMESPPFKTRLDAIVKNPDNAICADCPARGPRWSSVKLGILICANCAGIHRKLGTHISFVQSVTIDKWKQEWVELCEKIGNRISNLHYEANIPPHLSKPSLTSEGGTGGDTMDPTTATRLEKWLRNKYELQIFVAPGSVSPIDLVRAGGDPSEVYGRPRKPIKKERKKKKDTPSVDEPPFITPAAPQVQLNIPPDIQPIPIQLPEGFDWKNNVFIRSWAVSQGVHVD